MTISFPSALKFFYNCFNAKCEQLDSALLKSVNSEEYVWSFPTQKTVAVYKVFHVAVQRDTASILVQVQVCMERKVYREDAIRELLVSMNPPLGEIEQVIHKIFAHAESTLFQRFNSITINQRTTSCKSLPLSEIVQANTAFNSSCREIGKSDSVQKNQVAALEKLNPGIQEKCKEVLAKQYQEFLTACKQQPQLEHLIKRKYRLHLEKENFTFYVTMILQKDVYRSLLDNNPKFDRLLHIKIASKDIIFDYTFRKIIEEEKLYSLRFDECKINGVEFDL